MQRYFMALNIKEAVDHVMENMGKNAGDSSLQTFIDKTIKPVLILGGIGTALAGLNAFLPRFAVENVQKLDWVPEYTIFVQHWGIMVCLMGVFMVAAAFKETWRVPILLYGMVEKAFMVYLVASNWGRSFSGGFLVPAVMDTLITAWSLVYFASLRRESRQSIPPGKTPVTASA